MRPPIFALFCWIVLPCWIALPATLSAQQQPAIRTLIRPPPIRVTLCFEPRGSLALSGAGLPASQGDRRVLVRAGDATIELPVESWTATKIIVRLPGDSRLAPGGSYPLGIRDGGGTWLADADRPLVLCEAAGPILLATPGLQAPAARVGPLAPPSAGVLAPRAGAPGVAPPLALPGKEPPRKEPTGEGVAEPAEEVGRPAEAREEPPPGFAISESREEPPSGTPVAEGPSAGPVTVATPALRLTGYGAASPPRPEFSGRALTTPALRLTGYGAAGAPRAAFEPRTVTTPAIRLTGAGP